PDPGHNPGTGTNACAPGCRGSTLLHRRCMLRLFLCHGDSAMSSRPWLRRLFGYHSQRRTTTRTLGRSRPPVEVLEDRLAPSSGPASHFQVSPAASQVNAGAPFDITVTAQDAFGNTATSYTGTVQFVSSDPHPAILPADYTFTAADAG